MRKKTILSIGALTLACGLGIAAMGGANLLPLTLSAGVSTTADTPTYLKLVSVTPADNSVMPLWEAPANLVVAYTDASPATFPGCMVNKELSAPVKVNKVADNGDLVVVKEIPASSVTISKNYNEGVISFAGIEWEAGKYQIDIPEGLLLRDTDDPGSLNPDDPGSISIAHNKAMSVTYEFIDTPRYTTVPANGATANSAGDGLKKVVVTWDAEKVSKTVIADPANIPVINLVLVDEAGVSGETAVITRTVVGTYSPICEGNKLTLNLTLAEGVESLELVQPNRPKYYELSIPAGYVDLYDAEGKSVKNLAIDLTKIALQYEFDASLVKIVDLDETEFTPSTFPRELVVQFPGKVSIINNTYCKPYICREGDGSTSTCGQYAAELAPNGTTLLLTLPEPKAGEVNNNPEVWFDGEYYIMWKYSDPFQDEEGNKIGKNMKLTLGNLKDAYSHVTVSEETINNSSWYIYDGDTNNFKETLVNKDQFGNVSPDPGFDALGLKFYYNVIPVVDETKKISFYKDGETTPVWSQSAAGVYGTEHLWVGQPTATTKTTTSAVGKVYILNNVKEETFTRGTSSTKYRIREYLKEPGTYRVVIDEGFFNIKVANKPALPSAKIEVAFTIVGKDIEYSVSPAFDSDLTEINEFQITYPEGASVTLKEGAKADLIGNVSMLGGPDYNIPYTLDIKSEGNVVTLYAPVPFAIPYKTGYELKVPANSWTVTYNGETQANREIKGAYKLSKLSAGTVTPDNASPVLGADLASIIYTSKVPVKDAGAKMAQLLDAEGNVVAGYTFANAPVSEDGDKPVTECYLSTATDLSSLPVGEYKLVVYTNTFVYSYSITQDENFEFVYNVKANPSDSFTRAMPATSDVTYTGNNGVGMNMIGWEFTDAAITLNTACTSPVELKFNNETIATVPASAVIVDAPMDWNGTVFPGAVSISFPEIEGIDYTLTGEYAVVVPADLFLKDGQPLGAFSKVYTYTNDKPVVDFTYTLNPESGKTTDSLEEIVLTFTNASSLNYVGDSNSTTNPVAVLASEDGSLILNCGWPKIDGNSLVLSFGETMTEWKNGKYTLTVRPGMVNVDDVTWDEYSDIPGNFEGLTAEYTLEGVVQAGSLRDHVTYSVPSSLEANPLNTRTPFGATAMGIIALGIDTDKLAGVPNCDFLLLSYSATPDGEYSLLSAINPNNELEVNVIGVALTNGDDGLIEFPASNTLFMLFANDGDGSVDMSRISEFSKTGYYKLTIPDGSFAIDGAPVKGLELVYHYDAEAGQQTIVYELSPAASYTFTNVADLKYGGSGITVKFPKASFLDYVGTGGAVLITPAGEQIKCNTPSMPVPNELVYTFGNKNTEWVNGTYTLKIAAKMIAVDMGYLDYGDEGNSPVIEAAYHLEDQALGVALIGVGAADSYTVYTLDGKVVKVDAAIEELKELEPGLYIINGKKAYLRK